MVAEDGAQVLDQIPGHQRSPLPARVMLDHPLRKKSGANWPGKMPPCGPAHLSKALDAASLTSLDEA